ncbi:DNA methyltransferase [Staphylococcus haemolyticus]|uniref:DNA methyltransferase n=1 Tax=Staphylococcus haemolyticus TaxID=1283 RepID=UPI0030BFACE0
MKLTIKEASEYITKYLREEKGIEKDVKPSNISYLIQYGRISKIKNNNRLYADIDELISYYNRTVVNKHNDMLKRFGEDYNLKLAFANTTEKDRTKHVHRLHPYKGKFIPQLVEYFIDNHTDSLKKQTFFDQDDIILDPFLGSGTTVVEGLENGLNGIGIDISEFNCLLSEVKLHDYDTYQLENAVNKIIEKIEKLEENNNEQEDRYSIDLKELVTEYNKKYFPNPEFKVKVQNNLLNEKDYSEKVIQNFNKDLNILKEKNNLNVIDNNNMDTFMDLWLLPNVKKEAFDIKKIITSMNFDKAITNLFLVVLTKTVRSSRATKHTDLATLKSPTRNPYYCKKHYKICTPVTSCLGKFKQYLRDTLNRVKEYQNLKQNKEHAVIHGDSSTINILEALKSKNSYLYDKAANNQIKGIFTSPPYLGVINYHEQHAYAYELLNIERYDDKEIGKLMDGKSKKAKNNYIESISNVFINCKQYLADDFDIFIVANDDLNIYPEILKKANLKIVQRFERPVLNRTERNKKLYTETIFHCKEG